MERARANNGLPVNNQRKIPKNAPATQILFLQSHLLSPYLIERMATANCETQSHAGRRRTCQDAPDAHELIKETKTKIVQVHQDAKEGFVLPFRIDLKYGAKAMKETAGAIIPKIS
jgi:hypothetical protein